MGEIIHLRDHFPSQPAPPPRPWRTIRDEAVFGGWRFRAEAFVCGDVELRIVLHHRAVRPWWRRMLGLPSRAIVTATAVLAHPRPWKPFGMYAAGHVAVSRERVRHG